MNYVRSISGSVSKTWNSINPATLSGAIDVIVVEQADGSLACSPFHVRFGKFSLLRPYEKKVEFRVNNVKQDYSMKLGEGGEAFFIFETSENIPASLQTSPLVSPVNSPPPDLTVESGQTPGLLEPDYLDLTTEGKDHDISDVVQHQTVPTLATLSRAIRARSDLGDFSALSLSTDDTTLAQPSTSWSARQGDLPPRLERSASEEILPLSAKNVEDYEDGRYLRSPISATGSGKDTDTAFRVQEQSSNSPPTLATSEAVSRAMTLSKKLSASNIQTQITETGDLILDMAGYKSNGEEDALRGEVMARKLLSDELEGNYDIGSLIRPDEKGRIVIYNSEEAKEAAARKSAYQAMHSATTLSNDAASDPGYHSESDESASGSSPVKRHQRAKSELPPETSSGPPLGIDATRNFAKTLRLTSEQLKQLKLKAGANSMSFTVNRATCQAYMYLWTHDVPIVVSDVDGTITKSDALGHVLNMIGRDWTHLGVAKLYSDIVANGYNIFYLTSRSVGQADTTRAYLNGVVQEGYKLPKGPVIMSPDRTLAALRREVYLRKPEMFKMACLRDLLDLFPGKTNPFYAGFGNRFTDALSYRSVNIPSARIFTINSNAEVSLDLLSLNKYKISYVSMREIVDHFFPPVSMLVKEGGEDFTDFNYWRDSPRDLEDFSATDSEDGRTDDDDDEQGNELGESYLSRDSMDQSTMGDSILETIETNDRLGVRAIVEVDEDISNDYLDDQNPTSHGVPLSTIVSAESTEDVADDDPISERRPPPARA